MKTREKKYEDIKKLDELSEDSEKEAEKQLKNMLKELDKILDTHTEDDGY